MGVSSLWSCQKIWSHSLCFQILPNFEPVFWSEQQILKGLLDKLIEKNTVCRLLKNIIWASINKSLTYTWFCCCCYWLLAISGLLVADLAWTETKDCRHWNNSLALYYDLSPGAVYLYVVGLILTADTLIVTLYLEKMRINKFHGLNHSLVWAVLNRYWLFGYHQQLTRSNHTIKPVISSFMGRV